MCTPLVTILGASAVVIVHNLPNVDVSSTNCKHGYGSTTTNGLFSYHLKSFNAIQRSISLQSISFILFVWLCCRFIWARLELFPNPDRGLPGSPYLTDSILPAGSHRTFVLRLMTWKRTGFITRNLTICTAGLWAMRSRTGLASSSSAWSEHPERHASNDR